MLTGPDVVRLDVDGQSTCRRIVTGSAWRDPVLQAEYDGWFSPYLKKRTAALPTM